MLVIKLIKMLIAINAIANAQSYNLQSSRFFLLLSSFIKLILSVCFALLSVLKIISHDASKNISISTLNLNFYVQHVILEYIIIKHNIITCGCRQIFIMFFMCAPHS